MKTQTPFAEQRWPFNTGSVCYCLVELYGRARYDHCQYLYRILPVTLLSQGTWVVTSYAVAEAICVPLTGWLAGRFGTVRVLFWPDWFYHFFFLVRSSKLVRHAGVFPYWPRSMRWPLMPLSQTLLMRIFPQEKHAQAMGLWAMTTVVGPILGPILVV